MNLWMVIGGGLLAGGLALAWWRLHSLAKTVEQWTRRQYYDHSAVLETTRRQSDDLDVLRLHLAQVVAGTPPDEALVRAGYLYRQVSAEDARQLVAAHASGTNTSGTNAALVIVDVRSRKEFLARHLPGARHVPLEELDARGPREVPRDAGAVLVYCAQGERSRVACEVLSRRGYMNLVAIRDGLQSWTGPVLGTEQAALIRIESPGRTAASGVEPEPAERRHG